MDTEYVISGSIELGGLTPLEAQAYLDLPNAYWGVRNIVDNNLSMPDHYLQNTARSEIANLPKHMLYTMAIRAMPSAEFIVNFIYDKLTHSIKTILDKDSGTGIRTPFMFLIGIEEGHPFNSGGSPIILDSVEKLTESNVLDLLEFHHGGLIDRLRSDYALMMEAAQWYRQDNGNAFRKAEQQFKKLKSSDKKVVPFVEAGLKASLNIDSKVNNPHSQRNKVKGAIKKVTRLFSKFGWSDNLKLIVSGKEITISNPNSNLKFVVNPPKQEGWLEARTLKPVRHTPFDLSVYSKEGLFVTRLCVYFEETPVLDQLLALSLYIQSGDEVDILSKANWFGLNLEAKEVVLSQHPSLAIKYAIAEKSAAKMAEFDNLSNRILSTLMTPDEFVWQEAKGRVDAWVRSYLDPVFSPDSIKNTGLLSVSNIIANL